MYTRMSHIRNGYTTLGEKLTDDRVVGKLLRAMPPSWEMLRVSLETMMATQELGPEDLINYFRNFESRLKQVSVDTQQPRNVAMPASTSYDRDEDKAYLVRQYGDLRAHEKRFNDNRRRNNKKLYCFKCNKMGHMMDKCYTLHPELAPWNTENKSKSHSSDSNSAESDSDSESEMANVALMALTNVDELCERAIQEMLRRQGRVLPPLLSLRVEPLLDTPSPSSSHDMSREVYLDPTLDYVIEQVSSSSSNNEIVNVELKDRDDLEREVVKLRDSLNTTKELLFISEILVRSYSAKLKDFEKSKILNEIDLNKIKC